MDYKTMWQHPGMKADTIRGTVSDNIADATEDWVGGDTAYGNLYALAYETGMDLADELVATTGLKKLGMPGGKTIYELSQGHKGYMDSIAQGKTAAEAQLDAIRSIAEDDIRSQFGHAAIEAMTPDERSQKIATAVWKLLNLEF